MPIWCKSTTIRRMSQRTHDNKTSDIICDECMWAFSQQREKTNERLRERQGARAKFKKLNCQEYYRWWSHDMEFDRFEICMKNKSENVCMFCLDMWLFTRTFILYAINAIRLNLVGLVCFVVSLFTWFKLSILLFGSVQTQFIKSVHWLFFQIIRSNIWL